MANIRSWFKLATCALLLLVFIPLQVHAEKKNIRSMDSVTILAASSLTNVLSELASIYTRKRGIAVSLSFDSSYKMANQIIEGETADIFISAHPKFTTDLKQRGLVDVFSLTDLARNSLVLAASKRIKLDRGYLEGKDVATILNRISNRVIPVIADPAEVPLGIYSEESLKKLKLWDKFKDKVIRTENARAALYLVAKGKSLGILYFTDAYNNPEVDILAKFPDELHEPIIYQAAVVAGENMALARDFLKFLQSKEAKKIFAKYQFAVE